MRKIFILFSFLVFDLYGAGAATIVVTVTNNQFTPANITNVQVGDVIRYNFTQGFHNATSLDVTNGVPAGANNINSGEPLGTTRTYDYAVTVPGTYKYVCEVHADASSFSGMVGQFTAQGALPVTLKEFKVAVSGTKPLLLWKTASETNVDHFAIKSSLDGVKFTTLSQVQAVGNSNTEQIYSYVDSRVFGNRYVFYVLSIVDKDGKETTSGMKLFKNSLSVSNLITQMNPNPVPKNGQLMIQFNGEKAGQMIARVYDLNGKFIMQAKMSAYEGINNGHLHAGDLQKGSYTVEFSLDGKKEVRKFVVQ